MPYVRKTYRKRYTPKAAATRKTTYKRRAPKPTYRKRSSYKPSLHAGSQARSAVVRPERPILQRGLLPFARSYRVRIPYSHETGHITSLGTASTGQAYRLNSLFDPDWTGTGHQPMQFDQLAGLYNKYMVYACKVDVEVSNPTTDGMYVGYNCYSAGSNQGSGYTLGDLAELRNCKMYPLNNSGSQVRRFSVYVPIHNLLGIPKLVYNTDRDNYAADVTTNPAVYAAINFLALDSTNSATNSANWKITLTYYAEFYEFKTQTRST